MIVIIKKREIYEYGDYTGEDETTYEFVPEAHFDEVKDTLCPGDIVIHASKVEKVVVERTVKFEEVK